MLCTTHAIADGSRPSQAALMEMGLGGLAVMSDEEALRIRGNGFMGSSVDVFGNSFATFDAPSGTSHSENGYAAEGRHFAFGANFSTAGVLNGRDGGQMNGGMNISGQSSRWIGARRGGNGRVVDRPGGGRPGGGNLPGNITATAVFAGGFSVGAAL
jgi:hypothetical protein